MASTESLLQVSDLKVTYPARQPGADPVRAVRGIDLTVKRGSVLALVGESGCGKSATAFSLMSLLPASALVEGSVLLQGEELVGATERRLTEIRGDRVSMIFQDPSVYLNPVLSVGRQISEPLILHRGFSKRDARRRAIELLDLVGVPDASRRIDQYPHEFSGGMRQRAVIASALACEPALLIADEPTTALDVTVQADVLDLMRDLGQEFNMGTLLITHDMGVVADLADDVAVMKDGLIVERNKSTSLFEHPREEYTRTLLAAVPRLGTGSHLRVNDRPEASVLYPTEVPEPPALELNDVSVTYRRRLLSPALAAVDGVTLAVQPGELLGLVGESGSGKSTIAKTVVGLNRISSGNVRIAGQDVTNLRGHRLREVRRDYSIVFQDPAASLNPRRTVGDSLREAVRMRGPLSSKETSSRVAALLDDVRLGSVYSDRYPRELSGGQRQRVSIARALALDPKLLVADEPTSALDVSVQETILALFRELQREHGFACLFVTHDLAVVESLADHVAVLRRGKLVEYGSTEAVLFNPTTEYTRELLEAAPVPDPIAQRQKRIARAQRRRQTELALATPTL